MLTDADRVPIGRRAWIGDGVHGASVAPDGTIDWFCAGGLTSVPDLWRLLDPAGPALRVGPVRDGPAARRRLAPSALSCRPGANVVETVLDGPAGRRVSVIDFMPWAGPGLRAPGEVVRLVRALSGPVEIEVEVMSGPARRPGGSSRLVEPCRGGVDLDGVLIGSGLVFEAAPLDRDTPRWRALARLETGEETVITVGGVDPVTPGAAHRMLEDTEEAWRRWLGAAALDGPYRTMAERALLGLRALTGPGGAPHGSGTPALPRRVGSERCSDDRWVSVAHTARAVPVLAELGLIEDAEAAEGWLREMAETAHLPWPSWLDAGGQPVPEAEEQPLEGWRRSQPVVFGRPAASDAGLVGVVVSAMGASTRPGPLSAAFDALGEATDRAADDWRHPDNGPWGIAHPPRLYTAGRLWAWTAMDRMARAARSANPLDLRAATWQHEANQLRRWLEHDAVASDGGLRMDGAGGAGDPPADPAPPAGGSDEADAALLAAAWAGPWPLGHPLVTATVDRVLERLSTSGLLYRYSDRVADERAGPDHPDLEASLSGVRALARLGRWDEAHERMEAVGRLLAGGPGTFTETADPLSGELYGNFPATGAALAALEAVVALRSGPR